MGLTPNEGLIMGTRLGDIDAGALLYLADKEKLSIPQTNALINKEEPCAGDFGDFVGYARTGKVGGPVETTGRNWRLICFITG